VIGCYRLAIERGWCPRRRRRMRLRETDILAKLYAKAMARSGLTAGKGSM